MTDIQEPINIDPYIQYDPDKFHHSSDDYQGGVLDETMSLVIRRTTNTTGTSTVYQFYYAPAISAETVYQARSNLLVALFFPSSYQKELGGTLNNSYRHSIVGAENCFAFLDLYKDLLDLKSAQAEALNNFAREQFYVQQLGEVINSDQAEQCRNELNHLRKKTHDSVIDLTPQRLAGMFDAGLSSISLPIDETKLVLNIKTPHLGLVRGIIKALKLKDVEYTTPKSAPSHHLLRISTEGIRRFSQVVGPHTILRRGLLTFAEEAVSAINSSNTHKTIERERYREALLKINEVR